MLKFKNFVLQIFRDRILLGIHSPKNKKDFNKIWSGVV
jgi:hypothetical protein